MTPLVYLPEAAANGEFAVDAAKSRHLSLVLRLAEGAQVIVFDGGGNRYPATLLGGRQTPRLRTGERLPPQAADGGEKIFVGQAICAASKMDWAVEKMTELGCAGITPLISEKTRNSAAARQLDRWRRLTISACEQCGRAVVPVVSAATALDDWLSPPPAAGLRVLLSPHATTSLATVLRRRGVTGDGIVLACGAEGGFSADEERRIIASGFVAAHLGPRILRAETAALAALAVIQSDASIQSADADTQPAAKTA